jgi:hypothetical protein
MPESESALDETPADTTTRTEDDDFHWKIVPGTAATNHYPKSVPTPYSRPPACGLSARADGLPRIPAA